MSKIYRIFFTSASIVLSIYYMNRYEDLSIIVSGVCLLASILLYTTRVNLSSVLMIISGILNLTYQFNNNYTDGIELELILYMIIMLSLIIRIIHSLKSTNQVITPDNIISNIIKVTEIASLSITSKIILMSLIISIVFKIPLSNSGLNAYQVLYLMIPLVINTLYIIPVRDTVYIRIIYYIIWLQMLSNIDNNMAGTDVEAIIYGLASLISLFITYEPEYDNLTDESKGLMVLSKDMGYSGRCE